MAMLTMVSENGPNKKSLGESSADHIEGALYMVCLRATAIAIGTLMQPAAHRCAVWSQRPRPGGKPLATHTPITFTPAAITIAVA